MSGWLVFHPEIVFMLNLLYSLPIKQYSVILYEGIDDEVGVNVSINIVVSKYKYKVCFCIETPYTTERKVTSES